MKRIGLGMLSLLSLAVWSACSEETPMTTTAPAASAVVMQADGNSQRGGGKGSADDDAVPDESQVAFITRANRGADVANETIGPAGGRVRLDDFEIVVPRGAVDRPTVFSIRLKEVGRGERRPAMAEFGPHNQLFNVPVTIILPWSNTDAANARVHVIWWDKKTWVPMPSTFTNDGRVSTQTIHFSMYATCGLTVAGG
jgi:hypothetical protein